MLELFSIDPHRLSLLLKAPKSDLNQFEVAFRTALESANTEKEIEVMQSVAYLEHTLPIKIGSAGKRIKI